MKVKSVLFSLCGAENIKQQRVIFLRDENVCDDMTKWNFNFINWYKWWQKIKHFMAMELITRLERKFSESYRRKFQHLISFCSLTIEFSEWKCQKFLYCRCESSLSSGLMRNLWTLSRSMNALHSTIRIPFNLRDYIRNSSNASRRCYLFYRLCKFNKRNQKQILVMTFEFNFFFVEEKNHHRCFYWVFREQIFHHKLLFHIFHPSDKTRVYIIFY